MGAALMPLALGAGVVGAGISAVGAYQGAQARSANAAYQAQVAANNASIARINAGMETQAGEIQAGNAGLRTRATVGRTLAGQAASGVDVNKGSFVKTRSAEAELGMVDALTIRSNAAKKAWADQVQAGSFDASGQLLSRESSQASSAGTIGAVGSLLSSASSLGGSYYKYLQTAPPGGGDPGGDE